jgi:hypothetical protein
MGVQILTFYIMTQRSAHFNGRNVLFLPREGKNRKNFTEIFDWVGQKRDAEKTASLLSTDML